MTYLPEAAPLTGGKWIPSAQLAPELHTFLPCTAPPHPHALHICVRVNKKAESALFSLRCKTEHLMTQCFLHVCLRKPCWLCEHWFWWLQINVSQWMNEPIWNPRIMRTSCMMVGIQALELLGYSGQAQSFFFLAVLGSFCGSQVLHWCTRAFSSCRGYSIKVSTWTYHCGGFSCCWAQALGPQ